MKLTFNTQYVARNGEVFGPLVSDPRGFWTDGAHVWTSDGVCVSGAGGNFDILRVHTPPTPPAFATSA